MSKDSTTEETNDQLATEEVVPTDSNTSTEKGAADESNNSEKASDDMLDGNPFETDSQEEKSKEDEKPEDKTSPESPKFDEDLDEWAEKTGRDKPDNDRERKLLQDLRDSQREFTKDRQAEKGTKQLQDAVEEIVKENPKEEEEIDPMEKRFARLEADREAERTARLQSEFYSDRKVSESTGKIMTDVLREKIAKAGNVEARQKAIDYWSHPDQLEDLYDIARAREISAGGTEAIADEAAEQERGRIEKESKAAGPTRDAKSTATTEKEDPLMKLWST